MNKYIYTTLLAFLFLGCSTKKNKPLNKGYHSVVSSYNVLFNGNTSVEEGLLETESSFTENFWNILPIEKIKISDEIITVDGIENKNFLRGEEKAAKTIQKHSMVFNGMQMNPKIANAYLLLGKARYLDQRFVPALDAFNQVYKQTLTNDLWDQSVIWKAKSNIRLEQEALAIELLKNLLKKEQLNSENKSRTNAVLSMAYLQIKEEESAVKSLKRAAEIEENKISKARYLYILGQLLENQSKLDSANIYFKQVAKFHRKIPREFYVNAKLKTLLYDSLSLKNKESQILKMIDNYENEDFLDKIYYNYAMLLFSKDSILKGKNYLNKAIRENRLDKDLLSRGYAKISKMYFQNSDYVLAGKYLDSTMINLDKKSKQFWETQRQRKGLNQVIELENNISLYDSLVKISFYDKEKLKRILTQIESSDKRLKEKRRNQSEEQRMPEMRRTSNRKSNFYFYDDNLVKLGKSSFESLWGQRTRESYWRNSKSVALNTKQKKEKEKDNDEIEKVEIPLENSELLALIPTTEAQKDSIKELKNQSSLKVAELYLVKYKDYDLAENRLKRLIKLNPKKEVLAESNYLLFKLYRLTDKKKAQRVKKTIIRDFAETKFSKILQNSNNLVLEEEVLKKTLDSFQTLFNKQKFEQVIQGIDKKLSFIESKEMSFDYELLKVASIGRLEGILKYDEKLKELVVKYPNSDRKKEIQKINNEINKKWKSKKLKTVSGKHFLVFVLEKEMLREINIDSISSIIRQTSRVSLDVYDSDTSLLVVKDFENKENANDKKEFLEENIDFLRLKNNFVVLSSQYKNMLIYKTLGLYKED